MSGNTGFNYLDELSDEERALVFKQTKEFWDSLTVEQRSEYYDAYYTAIREKRRSNPLLMNNFVRDTEVAREILNVDLPKVKQEAIAEADRNNNLLIAEDLRRRRIGVDTFAIEIIEEEEDDDDERKKQQKGWLLSR